METQKIETDYLLQIASMMKEISSNLLQTKQLELQAKMLNGKFFYTTEEVADLLDINIKKVRKMYYDGVFNGIEDGKSIKIYRDSVEKYLDKTKTMLQDDYFMNRQNIMKRAKVTRTEFDKIFAEKKKKLH